MADVMYKGMNTFPMIAFVQTGIYFLRYLRNQFCNGDCNLFVHFQRKNIRWGVPNLKEFLEKVFHRKPMNFIERCTYMLNKARKTSMIRTMNSGYDHNNTSTSGYINRYQNELKFFYETSEERSADLTRPPIKFRMPKVKLLLLKGNSLTSAEVNLTNLAYCLATCSQFLDLHTDRREKSFFEAIEMLYIASTLLSYLQIENFHEVQRSVQLFLNAANLSSQPHIWSTLYLRDAINMWLESIHLEFQEADASNNPKIDKIVSYNGLDARVMLVALNLWHSLTAQNSDTASTTETLRHSLDDLQTFSEGIIRPRVPRIFLTAKQNNVLPSNPFMHFLHIEHFDWYSTEIKGKRNVEDRELSYRNHSSYFWQLRGKFRDKSDGTTSVECEDLGGFEIRCDKFAYKGMFPNGQVVRFIVGLAYEGIWAHGLVAVRK
mmetsp:Transcript_5073/g.7001  ORF Transcript_5073/g.7001 Transcript_5073/m.7001 type:complete len:433 (+) Transcript_5073:3-1301(+)